MAVAITNQQVAAVFAGAFYCLFNLFSGFLIPRPYGDVEDTIKVPGMMEDPTIKWYIQNHHGYDPSLMHGLNCCCFSGLHCLFRFHVCLRHQNVKLPTKIVFETQNGFV
ncbi:hypothetical protein Rs2_26376 [Raphanus sativus]|nr:hypothetical protein Rs2_44856 [Raphanus sativus]KAJ4886628.1 hypothetical protein Rs2_26376 [Raphanus sativus]